MNTASRVSSSSTDSTLVVMVPKPNLRWAFSPDSALVVATEASSTPELSFRWGSNMEVA